MENTCEEINISFYHAMYIKIYYCVSINCSIQLLMYYKGKWQTISCSDYTDFSARPTVTKSLEKVIKIAISTLHQISCKLVINCKQKYIFCWIIDAKVLCFLQVIGQDVLRLLVGKNILVLVYCEINKRKILLDRLISLPVSE